MTKKILFLAKFGGFSLTITDFILLRTEFNLSFLLQNDRGFLSIN